MNSLIAKNPISKGKVAFICRIQLKLWLFGEIFCLIFSQNLIAVAKSLRTLQSENVLRLADHENPLL